MAARSGNFDQNRLSTTRRQRRTNGLLARWLTDCPICAVLGLECRSHDQVVRDQPMGGRLLTARVCDAAVDAYVVVSLAQPLV